MKFTFLSLILTNCPLFSLNSYTNSELVLLLRTLSLEVGHWLTKTKDETTTIGVTLRQRTRSISPLKPKKSANLRQKVSLDLSYFKLDIYKRNYTIESGIGTGYSLVRKQFLIFQSMYIGYGVQGFNQRHPAGKSHVYIMYCTKYVIDF